MSTVNFKQVRDNYSLVGFFNSAMGAESKTVSGNTRFSNCPKCGPSSDLSVKVSVRNQKWHCFACNEKGDVIDAAAAFFGSSLADAAKQLVDQVYPTPVRDMRFQEPVVVKNKDSINRVIALLLEAQKAPDDGVVAYLKSRAIERWFTVSAVSRKLLITLPSDPSAALQYLLDVVGHDLLVESGIWKDGSKCPAIVYRPLGFVSTDGQGIEFRIITESEVAVAKAIRYGEPSVSVWKGDGRAMVVEGGIDMLSAACLGTERTIYSVPGARNWVKEEDWLRGLKGSNVLLALDSDAAGDKGSVELAKVLSDEVAAIYENAAQQKESLELSKVLSTVGSPIKRHAMPVGCKDLNDELRSKRLL